MISGVGNTTAAGGATNQAATNETVRDALAQIYEALSQLLRYCDDCGDGAANQAGGAQETEATDAVGETQAAGESGKAGGACPFGSTMQSSAQSVDPNR